MFHFQTYKWKKNVCRPVRVKVHLGRKSFGTVRIEGGAASPALSHTTRQCSQSGEHTKHVGTQRRRQEVGKCKASWKYTTPTHALKNIYIYLKTGL